MKFLKTILTIIIFFFISIQGVEAGNLSNAFDKKLKDVTTQAGYSDKTNSDSLLSTISTIIKVFLSMLGVIFLVLMIYGGYLWMIDQGNNDKIKKAQSLITAAVVGLIIVLLAYAISYLVLSTLGSETLSDVNGGVTADGSD